MQASPLERLTMLALWQSLSSDGSARACCLADASWLAAALA
jgi:hypothetical protein